MVFFTNKNDCQYLLVNTFFPIYLMYKLDATENTPIIFVGLLIWPRLKLKYLVRKEHFHHNKLGVNNTNKL